jgi:micrococcal nuclease
MSAKEKPMKIAHAILPLFLVAIPAVAQPPKPFTGKVVRVIDGDTIPVLLDCQEHRIRLTHIDCPETRQAFSEKAKQALSDKIFGKDVTVAWAEKDRYGRILADIHLGERFINREMVADGMAWHFKQYSKDALVAKAELEAREARRGLWADPNPVPPWEFRKRKK